MHTLYNYTIVHIWIPPKVLTNCPFLNFVLLLITTESNVILFSIASFHLSIPSYSHFSLPQLTQSVGEVHLRPLH